MLRGRGQAEAVLHLSTWSCRDVRLIERSFFPCWQLEPSAILARTLSGLPLERHPLWVTMAAAYHQQWEGPLIMYISEIRTVCVACKIYWRMEWWRLIGGCKGTMIITQTPHTCPWTAAGSAITACFQYCDRVLGDSRSLVLI